LGYEATNWDRRGAEVFTLDSRSEKTRSRVLCDVGMDGRGSMFCGRAAERGDGGLYFFEQLTAGNLASFLSVMGELYRRAIYHGPVHVGVALTSIQGMQSGHIRGLSDPPRYGAREYRQTRRVLAQELLEPAAVARRMLQRLFDSTSGEGFDPFAR
jgi:hypothetical protein